LNILAIKQLHENYHLKKGDPKLIRHTNIGHKRETLFQLCKNQFNVSKMLKEERIEANSCTLGSFSIPVLIISLQKLV
jgi:UDP-N-acetylglucosamine:LPS N-acetylglucosamine transferase